jgi:CcmD family protein
MKKMFNKSLKQLFSLGLLLIPCLVSAQTETNNITQELDSNASEWLQGSYRYNTVVAVLAIIFLGIWFYLLRMSRRLSKVEEKLTK